LGGAGLEIGKPGENRSQVVAHWQSDPAAGFHDRENATFGPASGLPMCRRNGRAPELVREFGLEDRSLSRWRNLQPRMLASF